MLSLIALNQVLRIHFNPDHQPRKQLVTMSHESNEDEDIESSLEFENTNDVEGMEKKSS